MRGLLGIGAGGATAAPAPAEPPIPAAAPPLLQEVARAHDTSSDLRTRFAGQDVYFWYDHHGAGYTTGAGAIALLAGMPIAILGYPLAYGVVVAVAILAGWRYGRSKGWYKCATCGEILHAPVPSACPGCGGTFRARIRSPMDRLAVEEGQE